MGFFSIEHELFDDAMLKILDRLVSRKSDHSNIDLIKFSSEDLVNQKKAGDIYRFI